MTDSTDLMPTTDTTERPIIFNDWSVRRILEGEKTQTRRLGGLDLASRAPGRWEVSMGSAMLAVFHDPHDGTRFEVESPYGAPGDVLWVREAFRLAQRLDDTPPKEAATEDGMVEPPAPQVRYEADGRIITDAGEWGRKRPSIHMPRELCRIRLRVEDVRVERLNEISAADIEAEGVDLPEEAQGYEYLARQIFEDLWSEIHGDGAWEENPWVWVVSFSQIAAE